MTGNNVGILPNRLADLCIDLRDYGGSPSLSDNSAALQAAVDAVSNSALNSGRRIQIGAGTWQFGSTIKITRAGVKFIGAGSDFWDAQNGTVLQFNGAGRYVNDVVTVSGNAQISSATANFTSADVGRTVGLAGAGIGGVVSGITINVFSNPILSVQDSQHATLKNAPQGSLTGVTASIQVEAFLIGADDGNSWDASEYNGLSNTQFEHLALTGVGNTMGANGIANLYAAATYGIRDWRGGGVRIKDAWISHFECGFWGVNSDFNSFDYVQANYCHVGLYFGPRSDQGNHSLIYGTDCDTLIQIDGASAIKFDTLCSINCGSPTTFGIDVGCAAQFVNVNCRAISFFNLWVEVNTISNNQVAFLRIDAATYNAVIGVTIDTVEGQGPIYPSTPYAQYFAQIGNATHVEIRNMGGVNPQFQHLLNFTAANQKQVVRLTGTKSGTTFPIPQLDYMAQSGSKPMFVIDAADENGFEFYSAPVNVNQQDFSIISQSADQNSQNLNFIGYGQTGAATGAVLTNKHLGQIDWKGFDGTSVGVGAVFYAAASENWAVGSHGTSWYITTTKNGTTAQTNSLYGLNDGSIQTGSGIFFGSTGFADFLSNVTIADNTGNMAPYCKVKSTGTSVGTPSGDMTGVLQAAGESYVLVGSTSNDDFKLRSNNVNRMEFRRGGEVVRAQSSTETTVTSSTTITTQGVDSVVRVTTSGAVTGVILQGGIAAGQVIYLRNNSANTITFDVAATSHVAGGTSKVIPAWTTVVMEYDGTYWN